MIVAFLGLAQLVFIKLTSIVHFNSHFIQKTMQKYKKLIPWALIYVLLWNGCESYE